MAISGQEEYPVDPGVRYAYPSNKRIKIDSDKLGDCLAFAVQKSSSSYYLNRDEMTRPYESCSFFDYLRAGFVPPQQKKEFVFFGKTEYEPGTLYAVLYKTGTEESLKSWILDQPDNSIDPIKLLMTSMQFNHGNVWNAVLAIHDLLRNNARWFVKNRYEYQTTAQDVERFFNKFIDIRGDLQERGGQFAGDHDGSWYRIWGVFLFRLAQEPASGIKRDIIHPEMDVGSVLMEITKLGHKDEPDVFGKIDIDQVASDASNEMVNQLWPTSGTVQEPSSDEWNQCLARDYLEVK